MNPSLTLVLFCVFAVAQVFCVPSAGPSSLAGSVMGGLDDSNMAPTRWIEFMDMDNDWSKLGSCYTIEAWVWNSPDSTASWQPILSRHPGMGHPSAESHFVIGVRDNLNIEVYAGCGCEDDNCGRGYLLLGGGAGTPSTWTHIAVSFDGDDTTDETTQTAVLYVNGEEVSRSEWAAVETQCADRSSQFARYADVKVGFMDAGELQGWGGMIDEIRFWQGVRSQDQVVNYHDVGLRGSEEGLFAYYQFSPENLDDDAAPKQIMNMAGDWLHGLPQPDPLSADAFAEPSYELNSYGIVMGQSDMEDLPLLPNELKYESYPEGDDVRYTNLPFDQASEPLQQLLDAGEAQIFGHPDKLDTVVVFVTCIDNDCSFYENNWKDYYFMYSAIYDTETAPVKMFLQIKTSCPSNTFDECGTCEGDNSQCQCVVYHGFESERMSYLLFQWSLDNLMDEVNDAIATLQATLDVLEMSEVDDATLRQQISDVMAFYNMDLTHYCGDLNGFMCELESSIPRNPEALINSGASADSDGSLPFIPSFIPNF